MTLPLTIKEALLWQCVLLSLMLNHAGGESVVLGKVSLPCTYWDLCPHQYLSGDNSVETNLT